MFLINFIIALFLLNIYPRYLFSCTKKLHDTYAPNVFFSFRAFLSIFVLWIALCPCMQPTGPIWIYFERGWASIYLHIDQRWQIGPGRHHTGPPPHIRAYARPLYYEPCGTSIRKKTPHFCSRMIWLHPPTSLLASRGYKYEKPATQKEERLWKREEGCHCRQGLSLCQRRVGGALEPNKTTAKKSGPLLKSTYTIQRTKWLFFACWGIFLGVWEARAGQLHIFFRKS